MENVFVSISQDGFENEALSFLSYVYLLLFFLDSGVFFRSPGERISNSTSVSALSYGSSPWKYSEQDSRENIHEPIEY